LQGGLVLQRVSNRVGTVLYAQLGQDRLDVVANRIFDCIFTGPRPRGNSRLT
jgi:hypothetical protein